MCTRVSSHTEKTTQKLWIYRLCAFNSDPVEYLLLLPRPPVLLAPSRLLHKILHKFSIVVKPICVAEMTLNGQNEKFSKQNLKSWYFFWGVVVWFSVFVCLLFFFSSQLQTTLCPFLRPYMCGLLEQNIIMHFYNCTGHLRRSEYGTRLCVADNWWRAPRNCRREAEQPHCLWIARVKDRLCHRRPKIWLYLYSSCCLAPASVWERSMVLADNSRALSSLCLGLIPAGE